MNPIQMLKMVKNPKEFVMNYMKQNNNNPMLNNLIQMAEKGQIEDLKNFGRNLYKENGRNFDEEYNDFMEKIKNGNIF